MLCIEKAIINIQVSPSSKNADGNIDGMVNFKVEKLNVDKEDIIKFMSYRDYRAIICIFRLVYKNKVNSEYVSPIRISGKR